MNLLFATIGVPLRITAVRGATNTIKQLMALGFIEGSVIRIILRNPDHLIIEVKGSRIAISKELANKIYVEEGKE